MSWQNKLFIGIGYGLSIKNVERQKKIWTHRAYLPEGREFSFDTRVYKLKGYNFILTRRHLKARDEFYRMLKIK